MQGIGLYCRTVCFSRERDKIRVTDIGLKSFWLAGLEVLGRGVMTAVFHCHGTTPSATDSLNSSASGDAKIGAPMRKNHSGNSSWPIAVGLIWSIIRKTSISKIQRACC